MREKVLQYKANGNDIKTAYMEMDKYAENVYISLREADNSNPSFDFFDVVFDVQGVFFVAGNASRQNLDNPSSPEYLTSLCATWADDLFKRAEGNQFIKNIELEVASKLGLDVTKLLVSRKNYLQKQEEKDRQRKIQEEEAAKKKADDWSKALDTAKDKFLNGEDISSEMFLAIVKRDGFQIHIRTQGVFNNSIRTVNKCGTVYYARQKGRKPQLDGCFDAIAKYVEFLENN